MGAHLLDKTRHIDRPDALRALADPNRVAILRRLMGGAGTLSQIGEALGRHPAWVRHHLLRLERAGLVELVETRKTKGYLEKYYAATARAYAVNFLVLPEPGPRGLIVAVGSHDLALELLARRLNEDPREPEVVTLTMGSLEGLIALRQGLGDVAGSHLLDAQTGEYNVPYARHLFPGRRLALVTLALREQGLLVRNDLAGSVHDVPDLLAVHARFVNRNAGSGTRLWLDRLLSQAGISPEMLPGYEREVTTHTEAAQAIARGSADACLGIRAAAQMYGLGFVPLFHERYDLVLPRERLDDPHVTRLLEHLGRSEFLRSVARLGGYETSTTGEVRELAG
jgi:molybdate-binding protein/DNA-binding HxlR family transcriptional regulator